MSRKGPGDRDYKQRDNQGYQGRNQDFKDRPNNYSNKQYDNKYKNEDNKSQGNTYYKPQENRPKTQAFNDRPNTYNKPQQDIKGYKSNYEESKQQKNYKPPQSTNKPVENKTQEKDFREEFKDQINEVKQFEEKMDQFKKEPTSIDGYYYLLSCKAMKDWKEYLDYSNIIADKRPTIHISCKPQKVNEDLLSTEKIYLPYPEKEHPCGVVLKPDLVEGQDYMIINENIWNFFSKKYPGTEVKRKGIVDENGKITLVPEMHVATLVFIYSNFLKALEGNSKEPLRVRKFQVPFELNVRTFKGLVAKCFNRLQIFKYQLESQYLRIWSMDPRFPDLTAFKEYLHETCVQSKTYDFQIDYNGQLLDRDTSKYLEEINPELKEPLIIEINQPGKFWTFFNDFVKACKKCHYCGKIDFLDSHCLCGVADYCSEACKYADKVSHSNKCDRAYDSDEDKEVIPSQTPIDGLAGLENLGNTCYMNCAIQCLSNIKELTEYFLSQKYKEEINEKNPLGTEGKLAKKFAYVIKKLWFDNRRDFSPYSLKFTVSKFQTTFFGQQQHDAQEFLFYLIDAIHEDLNRVLVKPYTNSVEAKNRSDLEVGKESWETFLQRNKSIIVDLMYGQFKSSIQCLKCDNISNTFESFSICSVPIPNQKEIEVYFIFENYAKKPYRILLKYPDNKHTLADLKTDLATLMNKPNDAIQFTIGDKYSIAPFYDLSIPTFQMCQDLKRSYLFAFELSPEDMKIPPQRRLFIGFQTLKADIPHEPKEVMGMARLLVLDKNMTNKEVHLQIFAKYRFFFDERWPFRSDKPYSSFSLERACDEAFTRFKRAIYDVYIVSGNQEKTQEGELKYNEVSFAETLTGFKDPEHQLSFEVDWRYIPSFVELEYLRNFIRHNPYKSGIHDKESGEKRFLDISDCLRCFAQPEELDENNAWYCKKCEKHQNALKVLEIYKIPKIFILHLKRFKTGDNTRWNRTESKINDMITFPLEDFDLSPFVINPHLPSEYDKETMNGSLEKEEINELKYDLVGVIHHIGNLNSGHYITYAKNIKTNAWYLFNDEKVRKVENTAEIVTDTAYILFYRRK